MSMTKQALHSMGERPDYGPDDSDYTALDYAVSHLKAHFPNAHIQNTGTYTLDAWVNEADLNGFCWKAKELKLEPDLPTLRLIPEENQFVITLINML